MLDDHPQPPDDFAHAIEAEFARLLDYYGISWQYEPKTFVLEAGAKRNVKEAFFSCFLSVQQRSLWTQKFCRLFNPHS